MYEVSEHRCNLIISAQVRDNSNLQEDLDYIHSFEVKLTKRSFIFSCKEKEEQELWVYIFELIAAMNSNNIPINKYNPFDVEQLALKKMEQDKLNQDLPQETKSRK